MSADQPLPSQDEIQKKLSEFMKQEFGDRVVFATQPERVETTPPAEEGKRKGIEFDFHLKPKDVKAHLDRFVIRQEDAKKALAIAVCDHYNHVKAAEQGERINVIRKTGVIHRIELCKHLQPGLANDRIEAQPLVIQENL